MFGRPTDMKTLSALLLLLVFAAGTGALRGFDLTKPLARTEVVFFEPEKFTDMRESSQGGLPQVRAETLAELRTFLVQQARPLLTAGQVLKITVTDVDLAGEFEPWLATGGADVRVVRDVYPPRISLAFRLTDADGSILAQGDRELSDVMFLTRLSVRLDDARRFEKALFEDWLHKEFAARRK